MYNTTERKDLNANNLFARIETLDGTEAVKYYDIAHYGLWVKRKYNGNTGLYMQAQEDGNMLFGKLNDDGDFEAVYKITMCMMQEA